jgi:hypothetical protein
MFKEAVNAIGVASIRAQVSVTEPATEVGDHSNLAPNRVLCVMLLLEQRNELVDMRAQRTLVHAATSARKCKEYCRAHARVSNHD